MNLILAILSALSSLPKIFSTIASLYAAWKEDQKRKRLGKVDQSEEDSANAKTDEDRKKAAREMGDANRS